MKQPRLYQFLRNSFQRTLALCQAQINRRLFLLCLAILAIILAAGLWPFNFRPENKVKWLGYTNGVHFYGRGIIFAQLMVPTSQSNSISIEVWVQPDNESLSRISRILSFCNAEKTETFFVGQWLSHLIVRARVLEPQNKWVYKEVGLRNVLPEGQRRFITVTADEKGTRIYVDGRMETAYPHHIFVSKEKTILGNFLLLGNSPTGKNYWTGQLFGLAIYNQSLTAEQVFQHFQNWTKEELTSISREENLIAFYPFAENGGTQIRDLAAGNHLVIPSKFKVLQRNVLVPPWKDFRLTLSYFQDIITNILGFIPFGFLISGYLYSRGTTNKSCLFVMVVLLGGSLSLIIELIQVYLPMRNSQLVDVITNTFGTSLGAVLFYLSALPTTPK
jgi:VanZ family protein